MATKTNILKKNLLEALEKSLGVVTTACKIVDCNRSTFYKYYNGDSKFREAVDELQNMTLDFVESQLHKQIKDGNTTATIFYLKTKGKREDSLSVKKYKWTDQLNQKLLNGLRQRKNKRIL